jgi:hypothetical protein
MYNIWSQVSGYPFVIVNWSPDVTTIALTAIKGGRKLCCSLLTSTSSMGRSGELSDFEHGLVIGCHISKKSDRNTATLLNFPKSTAGDVIVKWKREGTTTTKPRPGRPRLMADRDHRGFENGIRETRQTSSETITRWVPQCYELSSQHHDCASSVKRNEVPWASSCP